MIWCTVYRLSMIMAALNDGPIKVNIILLAEGTLLNFLVLDDDICFQLMISRLFTCS